MGSNELGRPSAFSRSILIKSVSHHQSALADENGVYRYRAAPDESQVRWNWLSSFREQFWW